MTYTIGVFIALHIALICSILFSGYIIKTKNKKQIHYAYLSNSILMGIWSLGGLLDNYSTFITGKYDIGFFMVGSIGLFFLPVCLFITSRIFLLGKINFNYKYKLLFIIPVISFFMLITNHYHNLYFITFSPYNYETVYGSYFNIHAVYSYICVVIALYNFIVATIKNSGLFSGQSILIFISSVVPLVVNVIFTYKILPLTMYITCVAFSFTIICTYCAILKYGFLEVAPIALRKVVDCMADGYIVVNSNMGLVDYNNSFAQIINCSKDIKVKTNMLQLFENERTMEEKFLDLLKQNIEQLKDRQDTIIIEKNLEINDKIYSIELTPIRADNDLIGIIIMFKDITELKNSQNAMIEQERLASLGQLAGGMAHDINTPIATIRMGIDFLSGKHEYTEQEEKMLNAMQISANKITEIVESVRNQIRNTGESQKTNFLLNKVIDNIKILVNNELEKHKCKLLIEIEKEINLYGDFGKLSQVIMNIVMNAIQAYNGDHGEIKLRAYEENENTVISVTDNAGGIPKKIADGLFKEILTTKGTKGTGFGLYFAKSMIKAEFNGDISFDTKEGVGTTFYIKIPN